MRLSKYANATYLAGLCFGMLLVYFLSGSILAKIMSYLYKDVMPDVTLMNKNDWNYYCNSYVRGYLASNIKHEKKPVILILGSSFSYGYSLPADTTYGVLFKKYFPEYKILNASVVGGGFARVIQNLLVLNSEKLKVDTLIIELNLSNVISDLQTEAKKPLLNYYLQYFSAANFLDKRSPYLTIFLARPMGFEAVKLMDLNRIRNIDPSVFNENPFNWDKLPDSYFENYKIVSKLIEEQKFKLLYMFTLAQQAANHIYFFVSPIAYDVVKEKSQFRVRDLRRDILLLNDICNKAGPKVVCLKVKDFNKENYTNITHFNQLGHANFAKWLDSEIRKDMKMRNHG